MKIAGNNALQLSIRRFPISGAILRAIKGKLCQVGNDEAIRASDARLHKLSKSVKLPKI